MTFRLLSLYAFLLLNGCGADRRAVWLSGDSATTAEILAAERLETRCGGFCKDAEAQKLLEHVAARVRAASRLDSALECRVLRSSAANAYSLPGRVYVTRGLLQRLDREELLAAAVAHEIAHLESGDSLRLLRGEDDGELQREINADRRAVELLALAGIRTGAMADLLAAIREELPTDSYATRWRALHDCKSLH